MMYAISIRNAPFGRILLDYAKTRAEARDVAKAWVRRTGKTVEFRQTRRNPAAWRRSMARHYRRTHAVGWAYRLV